MRKLIPVLALCLALLASAQALAQTDRAYINGVITEVAADGTLLLCNFYGTEYRLQYQADRDPLAAVGQVVRATIAGALVRADVQAAPPLTATALDECWIEATHLGVSEDRTLLHVDGPAIGDRWLHVPDGTNQYDLRGAYLRFRVVLAPGSAPEEMALLAEDVRTCYQFSGTLVTRQADSLILKDWHSELRVLIGPDTVVYGVPGRWHEVVAYVTSTDTSTQPNEAVAWSIWSTE